MKASGGKGYDTDIGYLLRTHAQGVKQLVCLMMQYCSTMHSQMYKLCS